MTDYEFAIAYLNAVERRHKDYFEHAKLSIINCVFINTAEPPSAHIINSDLPFDIRHDIEMMFWVV